MHEKEKKEVLSSANYVFALKPHLLQMEYIFFGVANATLSSTPITSECDSFGQSLYFLCFSNEFSGQKRPKNGFCRFAILAYDKSTRSHE